MCNLDIQYSIPNPLTPQYLVLSFPSIHGRNLPKSQENVFFFLIHAFFKANKHSYK